MPWETIIGNVISGAIGGLLAILGAHFLAKERESKSREYSASSAQQDRRRKFLSFMAQFKAEAIGTHPSEFGAFYGGKIPNIRHAIAEIIEDIPANKRLDFDKLVSAALDSDERTLYRNRLKNEHVEKCDRIAAFIRDLKA